MLLHHATLKFCLASSVLLLVPITLTEAATDNIKAGAFFSCAWESQANWNQTKTKFECWGLPTPDTIPVPDTIDFYSTLSAGKEHFCALHDDTNFNCFGQNTELTTIPLAISSANRIGDFHAGAAQTCVSYLDNGTLSCFGIANGDSLVPPAAMSVALDYATSKTQYHTCAVGLNQTAWDLTGNETTEVFCWGCTDSPDTICGTIPRDEFAEELDIGSKIAVGRAHGCVSFARGGTIECWGDNSHGQLDVPDNAYISFAGKIVAGDDFTCVINENDVVCWGRHEMGVTVIPEEVQGSAFSISAGAQHVCAIYVSGNSSLGMCWGLNNDGQVSPMPSFVSSIPSSASEWKVKAAIMIGAACLLALF